MSQSILETHTFTQFLIKAKQNTYAGGGDFTKSSRPTSKDLTFKEGELVYLDSYLGDLDFLGEEAVWYQNKPVWGMNYFGRMTTEKTPTGFGQFLKSTLLQVPEEMPFRGPEEYSEGEFRYTCTVEGDLTWFRGKELVFYKGEKIYQLYFHGGKIRSVG
ncbi:MAG: XRE family transcriptional regulator [Anaerolineaceae bacterium]|nr:XRE family transcriptional regulator [Anaerolineaceae bacterium]